jgi:lipopolysaccharide/colanic/teichoic acid biosynthesis glycosyltransferase
LIKRIGDCALALTLLAALLPLMGLIALGVRLTSPGPAVIATTRVGRGGRLFPHFRFRTMAGQPPRKTRFGRLIGNLSLDDLPTLWNVVRGDMSLIGPRPEVPENVDLGDPDWQTILRVRPGLAGPGLLTFLDRYNQTPIHERIQPDVYYARHASWRLDLALMASTVAQWVRRGHLKGRF